MKTTPDTVKHKIEPYSQHWEKLANAEARNFAPAIYPCKKCSYPVVTGYCCTFCGTKDPR